MFKEGDKVRVIDSPYVEPRFIGKTGRVVAVNGDEIKVKLNIGVTIMCLDTDLAKL